jgi:hypothetical protein
MPMPQVDRRMVLSAATEAHVLHGRRYKPCSSPLATCWTKVSTKEARGRRARLGPARTTARAGAPQIHQVLLLDLRWGADCGPACPDCRRGGRR